ncbi:MAG: hypothetical protein LIQ31_00490 [Planctomycetes bacterium]|nr:hypothetical protein [Planctomycetota bacterium]
MKNHILSVLIAVMVTTAAGIAASEPRGRQLSPEDTDRAINDVFNGAMGVTRMEADLITQKTGGMQRDGATAYEFLRLETPYRMVLVNRGPSAEPLPVEESTLIIVDGRNIWEVEARRSNRRSVSRRAFRPNMDNTQAQGLAVFIGLFLMGRDVTSASGIREDFDITCFLEPIPNRNERTLHFVLTPKRGGETLELWMMPGMVLPWKVRSFERKEIKFPPPKPGEPPRFKVEETTRIIRNVKTNLSGLPPFTAETFTLPYARDMVVRDEQTNQEMDERAIRAELEEVRREYGQ